MPTELRIKVYNHLRIIPADPNNDTTMIVEYRWHPGHGWKIHPSRDVQLDLFRLGLTCPTLRTETLTIMPTYRLVISDPTAYSLAPASKVTFHTASRYPVTRLTVSISAEGALNNAVGRLLSSLAMGAQLAYFRLNIDVPKTSGIILHPASLLPNLHLMTINWHLVRSRAGVALHCRKYPAITTEWERFKHAEEDRRKDLRRRTTSAGKRALWAAERARLQKLRERESVVPDVRAAVFALRELSGDPDAGAELLVDVTERRKVVGEGGWLLL
ncbi:hypothetical protein K461DRAFT_280453 [Myriangium duriaei CBS 260.36]|uniref:Uncharacterized protein n=1 Tax=Myriangium duriaei CBS 260.36 TaxID=1168546 RepID=A0A9P4IZB8_9PEZI|nr:hypothetical protein K461DRAFT_280453 [Myriangium duriaei CBS 260.36]